MRAAVNDRRASLTRGANLPVNEGRVAATVVWTAPIAAEVSACLVGKDGLLVSRAAIVSLGQPSGGNGAVTLINPGTARAGFDVDLASVPVEIDRILFCIAIGAGQTISCEDLEDPAITLTGSGPEPIALYELSGVETTQAAVIAELYRRGEVWKFRAVGQGYANGISRLAQALGCTDEDLRAAAMPPPPPPRSRKTSAKTSLSPDTGPAAGSTGHFGYREWILTEAGVLANAAQSVTVINRELLDLRADADGRLWPAMFAVQPMTGEELPPLPFTPLGGGRGFGLDGLPHIENVKALDHQSRRDETLPDGARLFASGGTPPRLVAVDTSDGRTWWKAPWSGRWIPIPGRAGASRLPGFANAAAATSQGAFCSVDAGLAHILIDQSPACVVTPLPGRELGAPVAFGRAVAVPRMTPSGITIFIRSEAGAITELSPAGGPLECEPLGQPVVSESGIAFWPGAAGFVALEPETLSSVWRIWPPKVEGLPFLAPFRATNGRLWALCRETGQGGRAVACLMSDAGARDRKHLLGPHASAGPATFRGRSRYAEPWADAIEEINLGLDYEGRWLLPLVRLGNRATLVALVDDVDHSGSRPFVFREGESTSCDIALALQIDNQSLKLMGQTFNISSTDDLAIFLDSDRLNVHHSDNSQCASWSLSFYR